MRAALEAESYRVVEAETVRRGVIEAGTRKPDVAVLDLGLPDEDGIAFIREVRAFSSMPILVLSARIDETDKVAALDAGADDYLTKPFGVAELRRASSGDAAPAARHAGQRRAGRAFRRRLRRPAESHRSRAAMSRSTSRPSSSGSFRAS